VSKGNGVVIKDPKDIKDEALIFYENLLKENSAENEEASSFLLEAIPNDRIDVQKLKDLSKTVTLEELQKAIFTLEGDKAQALM
ncbi:hypothetical protein KI387_014741, partial [Taxus chinensis]